MPILFIVCLCSSVVYLATTNSIMSTFAGMISAGDGGSATSALFSNTAGVALDTSGNLFVADSYSNKIRLVTKGTGIVTTYAGTGGGFKGGGNSDGCPATSAMFSYPSGIAIDNSGNLYIADCFNFKIRLVTRSTGIVTTFAGTGVRGSTGDGGPATSAQFVGPSGMTFDALSNLYIADKFNSKIRLVTKGTGIITTFAGTGACGSGGDGGPATSAELYFPGALAFDALGNLYIADSYNNKVRLVTTGTGIITTFAGTGAYGSSGDGGPATSARLYYPSGLAFDALGNLFISGNFFRMVTKNTGIISTYGQQVYSGSVCSGTSAALGYATSIALDASGNLYYGDNSHNVIGLLTKSTGVITAYAGQLCFREPCLATSAPIMYPRGIAVDNGNVYIADSYYHAVLLVMKGTGIITTFVGTGAQGSSGDGGPATSALLASPRALAFDALGNLYIADSNNVRLVMKGTGIITTFVGTGAYGSSGDGGPATSAQLNGPSGLAFDALGNLYIADSNNVRLVMKGTGIITTFVGTGAQGSSGDGGPATSAQLYGPGALAFDALGNLYIADDWGSVIRMVLAPGTPIPTSAPTAAPTTVPSALPSVAPSTSPTAVPTQSPSVHPSLVGDTNPPTSTPSVAPSVSPYPSLFPSFAPVAASAPVVAVQVVQTVAGVTSDSKGFRASFAAAVASLLPSGTNVTIISVVVVSVRQRRSLLASGVSVVYKVSSTQPMASLVTALSTNTAQLTASLQKTFPEAIVYVPTVNTAPSMAPTTGPLPPPASTDAGSSPSSVPLIVGVVVGVGGTALILAAMRLLRSRLGQLQQHQVATNS